MRECKTLCVPFRLSVHVGRCVSSCNHSMINRTDACVSCCGVKGGVESNGDCHPEDVHVYKSIPLPPSLSLLPTKSYTKIIIGCCALQKNPTPPIPSPL